MDGWMGRTGGRGLDYLLLSSWLELLVLLLLLSVRSLSLSLCVRYDELS